jgi:hypothetical protein
MLEVLLLELSVLDELLLDALVFNRLAAPVEAVLVGAVRSLSNCCSTLLQNWGNSFDEASLIVARNKVGIA